MGRMIYLHAYVPAGATPEVADEINGPAIAIDEEEYLKNPAYVEQKVVDDFIHWLKGKPEALRDVAEVQGGEGSWGKGRTRIEQYVIEAKERISQGRPAPVIGESNGSRVTMGKWKGKDAYFVRDIKTGRFQGWGLR